MITSLHPVVRVVLHASASFPAAPELPGLPVTELVRARLSQRGWTARIEVVDVCGEPDIRLRVTCAGSPVRVELLGAYPAPARALQWCAVRITPQQRTVWRGPHLGCPPDELLWFLEVLSADEATQRAQHYQVLS